MSGRFHEGQFVRSISLPSVELRVLRYVPANNAWACRIEGGFAVEFPEGDLVVAKRQPTEGTGWEQK